MDSDLVYPYELIEVRPRVWTVDGRKVLLSRGWRLKTKLDLETDLISILVEDEHGKG